MKILDIKYRCLHPSCVVNCREGAISLDEQTFNKLKAYYEDEATFRSPRGSCRLGFSQPYKAVEVSEYAGDDDEQAQDPRERGVEDPIALLMDEHQEILKKLDKVDAHIRKRDVDGLWVSTCDLENAINMHSLHKEEEVLFPIIGTVVPLGEGLVTIMREDHRELMSLLHKFRISLVNDEIQNGIATSILVNLRTHIRKEDKEFFTLINKHLTDDLRTSLVRDFRASAAKYVLLEPGDRLKAREELADVTKARHEFDREASEAVELARASASGCCH